MVYVADISQVYGYGDYKEINQQLAKENGELRQQLSLAFQENQQNRAELHRKEVELIRLRRQVNELNTIRDKFVAIEKIVTESCVKQSIEPTPPPQQQRQQHQTPQPARLSSNQTLAIEASSHESQQELPSRTSSTHDITQDQSNILPPIEEEDDSLYPPDVTSVPPITYDDRTLQTPSIWNCFDTLASEPDTPVKVTSPRNAELLSTPVSPLQTAPLLSIQMAAEARERQNSTRPREDTEQEEEEGEKTPTAQPTRYNLRKRTRR